MEYIGVTEHVLYMSINQDGSCLNVGTTRGFKVFSLDPFKLRIARDLQTSVAICECLYRTNIVAIVGQGENSKFPSSRVVIFDDYRVCLSFWFCYDVVFNVNL